MSGSSENTHDRSARRAARPRSRPCYGLTTIRWRGRCRQADLNTGLYRTVLRRGVSRRLPPEPSRLDIGLTVIDRSRGRMAGE
jgi:hypothetical protein